MLKDYNAKLESRNFVDNVDFTKNDECIWNVYPVGASGDLLASIINCHYISTGCNYFGITDQGQVLFRPSDYKITNARDQNNKILFDDQHMFDIATSLGGRNLNYSIMDQFIFSNHLYKNNQIQSIIDNFPKAKIINTYIVDNHGKAIVEFLALLKNKDIVTDVALPKNYKFDVELINHDRVMNIPFGSLFNEESYYKQYDSIIKFLNLNGRLICFDYVKYYMSKQHKLIKSTLAEYGDNL